MGTRAIITFPPTPIRVGSSWVLFSHVDNFYFLLLRKITLVRMSCANKIHFCCAFISHHFHCQEVAVTIAVLVSIPLRNNHLFNVPKHLLFPLTYPWSTRPFLSSPFSVSVFGVSLEWSKLDWTLAQFSSNESN